MIKMFIGAAATIVVAVSSWAYTISTGVAINKNDIKGLDRSVIELRTQYAEYDRILTELIHKQDKRITLLEDLINRDLK